LEKWKRATKNRRKVEEAKKRIVILNGGKRAKIGKE